MNLSKFEELSLFYCLPLLLNPTEPSFFISDVVMLEQLNLYLASAVNWTAFSVVDL